MGGAYSKEQGGPGDGIVVDTSMAAAASTLLYQLQYGGDDALDRLEASNGKKAYLSLVRMVRKARFERLLKVHRGALVSSMGSGFYGGDIFMIKY